MTMALDYATRAVRGRWPEFEEKIQKAKPGVASGYGAAEYAIRAAKMPWSKMPGIKRKKNGKINAEECMEIGNPSEAARYAEAFFQGERQPSFEQNSLKNNNLMALIDYAAGTLKARMPVLEEKILNGEKDSQEGKGRRRYNRKSYDLPLEYAEKVIKGRWPEYEVKVLAFAKTTEAKDSGGEYEPSHGERNHWNHNYKIDSRIANYIKQVCKGRWLELEAVLLERYSLHPQAWVSNQNMVDGYLTSIADVCKERYQDNSEVPEPEGNEPEPQPAHTYYHETRKDKRIQKTFTKFQQDNQCYWPEGESRLVTRDPGYEQYMMQVLVDRAQPAKTKEEEGNKSWIDPKKRYVPFEQLKNIVPPEGGFKWNDPMKPDYTIYKGMYVTDYGLGEIEKYVQYFHSNGVAVPELEDILEAKEDLNDAQGEKSVLRENRRRWRNWNQPEPAQQQQEAEQPSLQFQSSLLKKKALVEMTPSPTMLPPRDDIADHLDEQMKDQLNKEVMQGVRPRLNEPKKKRRPQIDPRINPDGDIMGVASKQADYITDAEDYLGALQQEIADESGEAVDLNDVLEGMPLPSRPRPSGGPRGPRKPKVYPHQRAKDFDLEIGEFGEAGREREPVSLEPMSPQRAIDPSAEYDVRYEPSRRRPSMDEQEERMASSEDCGCNKTADYTDEDWMQDEAAEYQLDQIRDAEDEAKRHFMQEDYIKQLCNDSTPPKTMEEMWEMMGEEYTAEFYGYPYHRVPDFTDEETEGWEDKRTSSEEEKSEVRIRFKGKEYTVQPDDIMDAIRECENLSMANPGFPVVFIIDEEGVITEDNYINGSRVGETVEKFAFRGNK
jgi:hypothetical protein